MGVEKYIAILFFSCIPDVNLSSCLDLCSEGLKLCNSTAIQCSESCDSDKCQGDCVTEQLSCVDTTLDCIVACVERAEEELE